MREATLIHCEVDDPNRCQGINQNRQCMFLANPGTKYCGRHMAAFTTNEEQNNIRNYRLTKFKAQIEEKADSGAIKSLREEIGITRQVLETFINKCGDETDLMIYSNKISDLVIKIEKLVTSCHRLEKSTSQLLDKTAIIQVAAFFIDIISEYVDEEVQEEISSRLLETISNVAIEHQEE